MSEHSLPPDPASWPRDPFRLLGVHPGASSRDLRKAYLRLIRSYKPEHSPEEFQRIRQAYEFALPFARAAEPSPTDDEPAFDPPTSVDSPVVVPETKPTADLEPEVRLIPTSPDPWAMACQGEPEAAYRALVDRQEGGRATETDYLQLYWLLTILPAVEPARLAVDWLIRGLGARGADCPRMRELLRREMLADPSLALGDRWKVFFRRRTPPTLAVEVAEARWRAARSSGRYALILDDLHSLRAWVPEVDEQAWARLLIASAMSLAWADGRDADGIQEFAREVEGLGGRRDHYSDELYQLEYAQTVKAGLDRLGGREGPYAAIYALLSASWDEPDPRYRARLRTYVDQVAQGPFAALRCLDELGATAPAVLGRLSALLGLFEVEVYPFLAPGILDEIAPTIRRFLDTQAWIDYPTFRPGLLKFCLDEALAPGLIARTIAERPEFILTGKNPLAHAINADWPLRHAYRACEMARQSPEDI